MKKLVTYFALTSYAIFSMAYIIYGWFTYNSQILIAHFTGSITFITLLFGCLLSGFHYIDKHRWSTLLAFISSGLMGLGYFMYTFLGVTAENSITSSLIFDLSSALMVWAILLPQLSRLLGIKGECSCSEEKERKKGDKKK